MSRRPLPVFTPLVSCRSVRWTTELVDPTAPCSSWLNPESGNPLADGPFARLLRTLSLLQGNNPAESSPIRLALVTARSMPAHERVIRTLHAWNVRIDEAFFMGGVSKTPIRQTFNPHIDFDDQEIHCDPASKVVPTARVPLRLKTARRPGRGHEPLSEDFTRAQHPVIVAVVTR